MWGSWVSLIEMSAVWFRVKALGHKNDVIQDGGFGHAVSAESLEIFEPEISYMGHQSCLGNGVPVKTLDTSLEWAPVSASPYCRHISAGNTKLPMTPWEEETKVPCLTFPLTYMPFPGQFFIYIFLKSCNPLDIYQEKIICCKDTRTSVFLATSGLPWWLRW